MPQLCLTLSLDKNITEQIKNSTANIFSITPIATENTEDFPYKYHLPAETE